MIRVPEWLFAAVGDVEHGGELDDGSCDGVAVFFDESTRSAMVTSPACTIAACFFIVELDVECAPGC